MQVPSVTGGRRSSRQINVILAEDMNDRKAVRHQVLGGWGEVCPGCRQQQDTLSGEN